MSSPSAKRCARCEILFDSADHARTEIIYSIAWQLRDWSEDRRAACQSTGELVPADSALSDRGPVCAQCAKELACGVYIELGGDEWDGWRQVPEPDWRPHTKNGDAFAICECGELMGRYAVRCNQCTSELRHAQTRPGRKPGQASQLAI